MVCRFPYLNGLRENPVKIVLKRDEIGSHEHINVAAQKKTSGRAAFIASHSNEVVFPFKFASYSL